MRMIRAWTVLGICGALAGACSSEELPPGLGEDDPSSPGADGHGGAGSKHDGGKDDDEVTCEGFVSALASCELIVGTRLAGCEDDHPVLPCVSDCVSNADCANLEAAYCDEIINGFATCIDACRAALAPPDFVCNDGTRISASRKCDGASDCAGGEDEVCPTGTFTCDDGLSVPAGWQCDIVEDCAGGEDEFDCPGSPSITCHDGARFAAARECDGTADCAGGEDELDCATLTCP